MAPLELPGIGRVRQGQYYAELTDECSNFGSTSSGASTARTQLLIDVVVHGGYFSSLLAKAATFYLFDEHKIDLGHTYTLHIEFLKPGRAGPIEFQTELVRKGSSMATVHVVAKQYSKPVAVGYFRSVWCHQDGHPLLIQLQ